MAKWLLIAIATTTVLLILVMPIGAVLYYAFQSGIGTYWAAITDPLTLHAIMLTLLAAGVAVPLSTLFGLAVAWSTGHFTFRGRTPLLVLIDLPLAVSPVIAGLVILLLYGPKGPLAPLFSALDWKIVFAFPGIALATTFVTLPYVARELGPVIEEHGSQEEQAALTLGASSWQMFFRVTLPKIKWGVLYGIILCTSRALGEFGAVSVVSGHIRGITNTLPLHIEVLYNDYKLNGAFAVASLLAFVSINTLLWKALLERRTQKGRM